MDNKSSAFRSIQIGSQILTYYGLKILPILMEKLPKYNINRLRQSYLRCLVLKMTKLVLNLMNVHHLNLGLITVLLWSKLW